MSVNNNLTILKLEAAVKGLQKDLHSLDAKASSFQERRGLIIGHIICALKLIAQLSKQPSTGSQKPSLPPARVIRLSTDGGGGGGGGGSSTSTSTSKAGLGAAAAAAAASSVSTAEKARLTEELLLAVLGNNPTLVSSLLQRGADPILANKDGRTPLLIATYIGHAYCVRALLAAGADPNHVAGRYGITLLSKAANEGHVECVKVLLAAGADPNHVATYGITPLLIATFEDHANCVKALLDAGADPNVSDSTSVGRTPLHHAINRGNAVSARMLLDAGANPNVQDRNRRTPLLIAAKAGYADCVRALLAAGANPNVENFDGHTPLLNAAEEGYADCVRALLAAGAPTIPVESRGDYTPDVQAVFAQFDAYKKKDVPLQTLAALALLRNNERREQILKELESLKENPQAQVLTPHALLMIFAEIWFGQGSGKGDGGGPA